MSANNIGWQCFTSGYELLKVNLLILSACCLLAFPCPFWGKVWFANTKLVFSKKTGMCDIKSNSIMSNVHFRCILFWALWIDEPTFLCIINRKKKWVIEKIIIMHYFSPYHAIRRQHNCLNIVGRRHWISIEQNYKLKYRHAVTHFQIKTIERLASLKLLASKGGLRVR